MSYWIQEYEGIRKEKEMFKVTLLAKKPWMSDPIEMSWVVIANTNENAIQKVKDDLDISGIIIDKWEAKKIDHPLLINVKE